MKKPSNEKRRLADAGLRRHRAPRRQQQGVAALGPCHEVIRVRRVALRDLVPGMVVNVRLPFLEDDGQWKVRPMVVVSATTHEVTALPCTTSERRLSLPLQYVEVRDLAQAGLTRETGVKHQARTVERSAVLGRLGRLSDQDMARIVPAGSDFQAAA